MSRMTRQIVSTAILIPAALLTGAPALGQCSPQEIDKLLASNGWPADQFSVSISISGDTAIIGAPGHPVWGRGTAYIFRDDGTGWVEFDQLLASDGADRDIFGASVSIDGGTAIIGAPHDDDHGGNSGSAYIFHDDGAGDWIERVKLTAPDAEAGDEFGWAVSINGMWAIVGAPQEDEAGDRAGAAYIFRDHGGGNWLFHQKLMASDAEPVDLFGISVALDGDTAVIGAYGDDINGEVNSGSAYFFRDDGTGHWDEISKVAPSDPEAMDLFGQKVAISGDTAIIGARWNDDLGTDSGSAYIFGDDGFGNWVQQSKLLAGDGAAEDEFGYSVAIDGDTAMVGAYFDDDNGPFSGSAYIFRDRGTGFWAEEAKILASDGVHSDMFGFALALAGNTAIVGAVGDDDLGDTAGSAYVFDLNCIRREVACADRFTQFRGIPIGGSFRHTCASDDLRWEHQPDAIAATVIAPIEIEFIGTLTGSTGTAIRFVAENLATEPGVVLRLSILNFNTNQFESEVFPNIPTTDTEFAIERTGNVADYIAPGGEVRGRVSYLRPAGAPPFWTIGIDQIRFELDQ